MTELPLPPFDTVRWTAARKAAIVQAIAKGRIDAIDALRNYSMSAEELGLWQCAHHERGAEGLKVTKIVEHRRSDRAEGRI